MKSRSNIQVKGKEIMFCNTRCTQSITGFDQSCKDMLSHMDKGNSNLLSFFLVIVCLEIRNRIGTKTTAHIIASESQKCLA
ncbi:hypothetical protein Hanom_Chr15g01369671 [Helianthus anomalus]